MQTIYKGGDNRTVNLHCGQKNFRLYIIWNKWIKKSPCHFFKMKMIRTNIKVPRTKAVLDLLSAGGRWRRSRPYAIVFLSDSQRLTRQNRSLCEASEIHPG